MKLYVLIQSCDYNGEGYYQDSIKDIYQHEAEANKALEEAQPKEDDDYGCGIDVRWYVSAHDLI